jgi:hypothetical protein
MINIQKQNRWRSDKSDRGVNEASEVKKNLLKEVLIIVREDKRKVRVRPEPWVTR